MDDQQYLQSMATQAADEILAIDPETIGRRELIENIIEQALQDYLLEKLYPTKFKL
jgi:hypothetical protein